MSGYEGPMSALLSHRQLISRSLAALALLVLGGGLAGCASMGDTIAPAFADPARYDLYECKQIEPERDRLVKRVAELQGLMAKAETGVAGSVVAEMAYRNDYIAARGQQKLAEEAWRRNKCNEAKPEAKPALVAPTVAPAPPPVVRGSRAPSKSGSALY